MDVSFGEGKNNNGHVTNFKTSYEQTGKHTIGKIDKLMVRGLNKKKTFQIVVPGPTISAFDCSQTSY